VLDLSGFAVLPGLRRLTTHRIRNWGKFLKNGVVFHRLKDKLSVEKPHLTKTQKISSACIFPFQMECVNIVRNRINSSSEGCSDAIERPCISVVLHIPLVRFGSGLH